MNIYKGEEIKRIDAKAEQDGLSTFTLMENAGHAIYDEVKEHLNHQMRMLILSGKGNNGGDGIVLARLLKNQGYQVDLIFPLGMPVTEAARQHYCYFSRLGYQEVTTPTGKYDLIFDALLGIDVQLPIRDTVKEWITWMNLAEGYKIAIDVPTGVQSDYGKTEMAVVANETFCLHGMKPSAFLQNSMDYYGQVRCLDIGLPQTSRWRCWTESDVRRTYFSRSENAHKGSFGTGLLFAGTDLMPGCAVLGAKAALRSGIGKLTVGTSQNVLNVMANHLLECSYHHMNWSHFQIGDEIGWENFRAIAIGPGLDHVTFLTHLVRQALHTNLPVILDAAALQPREYPKRNALTVLTPHPREMSRMTGIPVSEIQSNRLQVASTYAMKQNVAVVLKGRKTVCAFPSGRTMVIESGNVSLAKGGTGDTLTGILLAFLCYYSDVEAAVCNAVYFHGLCADIWKEKFSTATMLASDLSDLLPEALKRFEGNQ